MPSSMKKIITPSLKSKNKGRRLTPIDIAWQRAVADSQFLTPEEQENKKRMADINKHKDQMNELRKQVEKMNNEVANMVKEINKQNTKSKQTTSNSFLRIFFFKGQLTFLRFCSPISDCFFHFKRAKSPSKAQKSNV